MEIGAAEFAVGDALQAHVLLALDDLADALVLDGAQLGGGERPGEELLARLAQPLRPQEAADVIGAEGGTGQAFLLNSSL